MIDDKIIQISIN